MPAPHRDLDFDDCYRATASRDERFDGRFTVGVTSTGIYCRPSCPAPVLPKRTNVRFFRAVAGAQAAGLRACKRCQPDAAPGTPEWDVRADLVGRAMRLIADGMIDRRGVSGLARRLAVSERHLHRLMIEEIGATPIQIARSQRARAARLLIETTEQPFSEIAFASGFSSIRQFNGTIREVFANTPTGLRRAYRGRRAGGPPGAISVRLAYREPLDAPELFRWFAARVVPGIETASAAGLRRVLRLPRGLATVELEPARGHVRATFRLEALADLQPAVARCRRLLDLDAAPDDIADALGADAALRPAVGRHRGLRVPGTVDGFELAVRTIIGQQISLAAARTMTARLVQRCGQPIEHPDGALTHAFPTPQAVADCDLDQIGLTSSRQATLRNLAGVVADEAVPLDGEVDRSEVRARLAAIPGIGPWTVEYVAMRALRDPDAFPASDLALRRRAAAMGLAGTAAALIDRADRWRPWRSYAAQLLWDDGN